MQSLMSGIGIVLPPGTALCPHRIAMHVVEHCTNIVNECLGVCALAPFAELRAQRVSEILHCRLCRRRDRQIEGSDEIERRCQTCIVIDLEIEHDGDVVVVPLQPTVFAVVMNRCTCAGIVCRVENLAFDVIDNVMNLDRIIAPAGIVVPNIDRCEIWDSRAARCEYRQQNRRCGQPDVLVHSSPPTRRTQTLPAARLPMSRPPEQQNLRNDLGITAMVDTPSK